MKINWYAVWLLGGGFFSAYWVEKYPWFAWPFMFVVILVGLFIIEIELIDAHNYIEKRKFEKMIT